MRRELTTVPAGSRVARGILATVPSEDSATRGGCRPSPQSATWNVPRPTTDRNELVGAGRPEGDASYAVNDPCMVSR